MLDQGRTRSGKLVAVVDWESPLSHSSITTSLSKGFKIPLGVLFRVIEANNSSGQWMFH